VGLTFERVAGVDAGAIVAFLRGSDWPFHRVRRLSVAEAEAMVVSNATTDSFWIRDAGVAVGVVRLLDLDDVDDGSPLFDLRIAEEHRGRGVGTAAVKWLSEHLFLEFPVLHRIEATTRSDNAAMMSILERSGYHLEGVLREAWKDEKGSRYDTMVYGLLRREWWASLPTSS
jgi:RimJ/RimL family protein N-acetyltransferase